MDELQTSAQTVARAKPPPPPALPEMTGFDRRRHDRMDTQFKAKISTADQKTYCDVLDMSEGGARVKPHSEIDLSSLTLHVLGIGSWFGDIVWRRGDEIGLHFHNQMDAFTLSTVL